MNNFSEEEINQIIEIKIIVIFSKMKFKKILVLGATGFIGKNITLYFSKKLF